MKETKRNQIQAVLFKDHDLILVENDVFNISGRIEEYDKDMFIVFNKRKKAFEIHSLEYAPMIASPKDTFQTTIPYKELDIRTLHHVYDNDIKVHGRKIFERIERQEELNEKQKQRDYKNWLRAVASETKSMFAKDAWL
ncbi:hypothetical protein [Lysinibacillus sp. F5]|uniref:hypothetical protein n=1 Tax=Lysinibacillus sp. F5 TaxID=1700846 RepID=UPI000738AA18|nr:hypothetical protein [Lysinibacillus sp. F5]KUF37441.1 hypothetical protein AK833_00700 [Lysinibacillus sp. F5]